MCSPGINGEEELRGKPANPGSPGKMADKTECVCVLLKLWSNCKMHHMTSFFITYSTVRIKVRVRVMAGVNVSVNI